MKSTDIKPCHNRVLLRLDVPETAIVAPRNSEDRADVKITVVSIGPDVKSVKPGDLIVAIGGRTGRDGLHGATFSSAELTDKHQDEFSHAVQIGNAITEKKVADVILAARDRVLAEAFAANPQRFVNQRPVAPRPPVAAWINKPVQVHQLDDIQVELRSAAQ